MVAFPDMGDQSPTHEQGPLANETTTEEKKMEEGAFTYEEMIGTGSTFTRERLMKFRDAEAEQLKARWAIEEEKDRERITTQLREVLASREAPITWQAACRDRDLLDVFYSEAPGAIAQAKSICAECPIRESCLEDALEQREPCGIWGGELFRNGHVITNRKRHPRYRVTTA